MKEEKKSPTVRQIGYAKSGYDFFFVRCPDGKSYQEYVMAHDKVTTPTMLKGTTGYCISTHANVFSGIFPNSAPVSPGSHNDFIVETHIIVRDSFDAAEVRRRFYHEIGHAVDFVAQHLNITRRAYGIKPEGHCSDMETRALLSEFLLSNLDSFLAGDATGATSGVIEAMPWAKEANHVN
jgi:hypothetical protein